MGVRRSLSTILDLSMLFETDQVTQSGLILGYFHVLQQHLVDIFLLLAPSLLSDRAQSGQQAAVVGQADRDAPRGSRACRCPGPGQRTPVRVCCGASGGRTAAESPLLTTAAPEPAP